MMKRLFLIISLIAAIFAPIRHATAADTHRLYSSDHSVYVVGDSLTCQALPELQSVFGPYRPLQINCWPGTTLHDWTPIVHKAIEQRGFPPTAVVALGTNDVWLEGEMSNPLAFLFAVEAIVDQFPASERVFLVNYAALNPNLNPEMQAANRLLALDATFHHNVTVIDWASVITQHPELYADGAIHLTPAGYTLRAQTILAAVGLSGYAGGAS